MNRFFILLALGLALMLGLTTDCGRGIDVGDDDCADGDCGGGGDDTMGGGLDSTRCVELIDAIYSVCGSNINEWERSEALSYCVQNLNADWQCFSSCEDTYNTDCTDLQTCGSSC